MSDLAGYQWELTRWPWLLAAAVVFPLLVFFFIRSFSFTDITINNNTANRNTFMIKHGGTAVFNRETAAILFPENIIINKTRLLIHKG